MAKASSGTLLLLSLILALTPKPQVAAQMPSICYSQVSLANQACLVLPSFVESSLGSDDTMLEKMSDHGSHHHHDHGHSREEDNSTEHHSSSHHKSSHSKHRQHHQHDRETEADRDEHHHSRDGQHHHHGHHHHDHMADAAKNCCRWLQQVDDICVCKILAHLPKFMSKPRHHYSVTVDNECEVTYDCEGI